MHSIKTTGDLRAFLGETLLGIRDGTIDKTKAESISKIAAQINQSLSVEVNAAVALKKLGNKQPIGGTMLIGNSTPAPEPRRVSTSDPGPPPTGGGGGKEPHKFRTDLTWCDQCERQRSPEDITACRDPFCKVQHVVKED